MLRVESVTAFYGAVQALRNVSIHVSAGEIATLLGANGAGENYPDEGYIGHPSSHEREITVQRPKYRRATG